MLHDSSPYCYCNMCILYYHMESNYDYHSMSIVMMMMMMMVVVVMVIMWDSGDGGGG